MQAIIMAAGKGSRLSPLTDNQPKCFIEICNKKLLDYQIEMYEKEKVEEIIIVTGCKSEMIEDHVKGKSHIKTVYNPFYGSSNVLTSFWFGMGHLKDDFIYSHADTIFDRPILEKLLNDPADIVLPIDRKICGEEEMKVEIDENDRLISINKTMNASNAYGEFLGIAKIRKEVLPMIKSITEKHIRAHNFQAFFEVALQDIIDYDKSLFSLVEVSDYFWNEIDFIEDYNYAIKNIYKSSLIIS